MKDFLIAMIMILALWSTVRVIQAKQRSTAADIATVIKQGATK